MFIRGSPPTKTRNHGHTEPLCVTIHLKKLLENNCQSPMFIRGPPPSTYTTTVWVHGTTVWVNSPQKTTGKNCQGPMFIRGPPPINTHNHCVGTRNHCVGQYSSKNYKNNLHNPMFIRGPPLTTHTTTVWAHGTTVLVNTAQKTTGKQLSEPHVYQGSTPVERNLTQLVQMTHSSQISIVLM